MDKEEKRCEPCEILSAAGMLIGQFAVRDQEVIDELTFKITTGESSLRDLSEMLKADKEFLDSFEEEGIDVDGKISCDDEGICSISPKEPEKNKESNSTEEIVSSEAD